MFLNPDREIVNAKDRSFCRQMAVDHLEMMELRQLLCPVTYWVSPTRRTSLRPTNYSTITFIQPHARVQYTFKLSELVFDHRYGGRFKWARDPLVLEELRGVSTAPPSPAFTLSLSWHRCLFPLCRRKGCACGTVLPPPLSTQSTISDRLCRFYPHRTCKHRRSRTPLVFSNPIGSRHQYSYARAHELASLAGCPGLSSVCARSVGGT